MKKISFLFSVSLICILFTGCTGLLYRKANNEYANLQYYYAIQHYNKVIAKKDIHGAKIKLANAYRLINDDVKAAPVYAEVVEYPEIEPIEYLNYANVLRSNGDNVSARIWYKKYLEKFPDDKDALGLLASCDSSSVFMRDTTLFTMNGVEFNELTSTFGCVHYKNGVVFTGDKLEAKKSKKNPWTGNSYLDLYYTEKDASGKWLAPQSLKGGLNGKYHEGPASFNKAGDVVYFTRSNYNHNQLQGNEDNVNTLKLYKAKLENDKWGQLEELPFNGDAYSVGHPFICKDEKTLYFISNVAGGFGGTDIYRAVFDGTTWSKPENLGPKINTSGNEMFPMMNDDSVFYFSSDNHTNMGGLDVFSTKFDENTKTWTTAENLLFPLNSTKDDFGLVFNSDGKTGFVSSNRNGSDKLYEFKKNDPTFNLSGLVTYRGYGTPVNGALIELINDKTKEKLTATTDAKGMYKMKLENNAKYSIYCTREGCFKVSNAISTKRKKFSENFVMNFELDSIIVEKPIVLENIYFDLDKWKIRKDAKPVLDSLVTLLKINPAINIEMSSHCDSRASDEYNLILSEKRAIETVKYLRSKGIDKNRLQAKGYGETMIVNKCANDVECTEEEHQKNRRTEFKVIEVKAPEITK